jgi:multidrug efflux pump subunit AcrA (membrane-fusion protein)
MRSFVSLLVVVVLVLGAVALMKPSSSAEAKKEKNGKAVRAVETAVLEEGAFDLPYSTTGNLEPITEAFVSPKVSGVVAFVGADIGKRVKKGDVLIEIDETYYRIDYETYSAALAVAKAYLADALNGTRAEDKEMSRIRYELAKVNLEKAERDLKRAEDLFKTGGLPAADYENAISARDAAKLSVESAKADFDKATRGKTETELAALGAQVTQAEAMVQRIKQLLDDCAVVAPFDGIVVDRRVSVGENVAPGTEKFRILDDSKLRFRFGVPERYAAFLKAGLPVSLDFGSSAIAAKVSFVVPKVEASSRTISAYVDLDNKNGELPAGILGEARLSFSIRGFVVPTSALVYRGESVLLCCVVDGRAKLVPVTPRMSSGSSVNIVGGLVPATVYVTKQASDIAEGDELTSIAK